MRCWSSLEYLGCVTDLGIISMWSVWSGGVRAMLALVFVCILTGIIGRCWISWFSSLWESEWVSAWSPLSSSSWLMLGYLKCVVTMMMMLSWSAGDTVSHHERRQLTNMFRDNNIFNSSASAVLCSRMQRRKSEFSQCYMMMMRVVEHGLACLCRPDDIDKILHQISIFPGLTTIFSSSSPKQLSAPSLLLRSTWSSWLSENDKKNLKCPEDWTESSGLIWPQRRWGSSGKQDDLNSTSWPLDQED